MCVDQFLRQLYGLLMNSTLSTLMLSARLPFLILAPVSVLLGISTAYYGHTDISVLHIILILVAALSAHISVNAFNEYADFRSGLDLRTQRTPFSGGSGGLVNNPSARNAVLAMAIVTLWITIVIGWYFIYLRGSTLVWLGLMGLALVVAYTPWLNRYPWLCWMAPGLGFGPVMVIGTHIALGAELSVLVVLVSSLPMVLANNLLLLNQFPDIEADKAAGRCHIPIKYGREFSLRVYSVSSLTVAGVVLIGYVLGYLPVLSLWVVVPLVLTLSIANSLRSRLQQDLNTSLPFLGRNVLVTIVTPVLMGAALLLMA